MVLKLWDVSCFMTRLFLRINKNTPDELWDCAIGTSKLSAGCPFQNDEVIIPSLVKELTWARDARDYSLIGCREIGSEMTIRPATACMPPCQHPCGVVLVMALNRINPLTASRQS